MNLLDLFETQLNNALPLTLKNVNNLRQSKKEKYSGKELEGVLKASRLDTDELVGQKIVYYLHEVGDVLNMKSIIDDEIETKLSSLKYVRMAADFPVFA